MRKSPAPSINRGRAFLLQYKEVIALDFKEFLKIVNAEGLLEKSVKQARDLYESAERSESAPFNGGEFGRYINLRFTLNLLEDYHNWIHGKSKSFVKRISRLFCGGFQHIYFRWLSL